MSRDGTDGPKPGAVPPVRGRVPRKTIFGRESMADVQPATTASYAAVPPVPGVEPTAPAPPPVRRGKRRITARGIAVLRPEDHTAEDHAAEDHAAEDQPVADSESTQELSEAELEVLEPASDPRRISQPSFVYKPKVEEIVEPPPARRAPAPEPKAPPAEVEEVVLSAPVYAEAVLEDDEDVRPPGLPAVVKIGGGLIVAGTIGALAWAFWPAPEPTPEPAETETAVLVAPEVEDPAKEVAPAPEPAEDADTEAAAVGDPGDQPAVAEGSGRTSSKSRSRSRRRRKKAEAAPTPTPTPTPQPEPKPAPAKKKAPPPKSGSQLLAEAKSAYNKGQASKAYALASSARKKGVGHEALRIMALAACGKGNASQARAAFDKLKVKQRKGVRKTCKNKGVKI